MLIDKTIQIRTINTKLFFFKLSFKLYNIFIINHKEKHRNFQYQTEKKNTQTQPFNNYQRLNNLMTILVINLVRNSTHVIKNPFNLQQINKTDRKHVPKPIKRWSTPG